MRAQEIVFKQTNVVATIIPEKSNTKRPHLDWMRAHSLFSRLSMHVTTQCKTVRLFRGERPNFVTYSDGMCTLTTALKRWCDICIYGMYARLELRTNTHWWENFTLLAREREYSGKKMAQNSCIIISSVCLNRDRINYVYTLNKVHYIVPLMWIEQITHASPLHSKPTVQLKCISIIECCSNEP